nr:hypothetical protein [Pectobacterium brasiliense]
MYSASRRLSKLIVNGRDGEFECTANEVQTNGVVVISLKIIL